MKWLNLLLPWPGRHERAAAIERARAEHKKSAATAAHSRVVRQRINRLAAANHYADTITSEIIRGHEGGAGGP